MFDHAAVPQRILVVQPNWVGDAVMATPTLAALRQLYPQAHIAYLMRRYVKDLYGGMPWADQFITYRTGKTKSKTGKGMFELAARLRSAKFDLAVLLPNSFKSALVCKMANISRILGYDRDGRGFLLTDRLLPVKERGKFVPSPIIGTYLGLARYLGSSGRDLRMRLFVTDTDRRQADEVFARCDLPADLFHPAAAGAGTVRGGEAVAVRTFCRAGGSVHRRTARHRAAERHAARAHDCGVDPGPDEARGD
jgi:hypothetical protein